MKWLAFFRKRIYGRKPPFPQGAPRTAAGWPVTPEALYWGPRFLYERYRTPILITENGMSCHDAVSLDGQVHDPNRIDYLSRYLAAYRRAARDGVNAAGLLCLVADGQF